MLPERFGRYEVLAELGDGAMGRVYSAWDPAVSRAVAIKTVKVESLSKQMADEFAQRFRREAQAAGALNHPNIVSIYDVGDEHIVMELVEGQTLQERIREKGPLDPAAALSLLGPVAEALDHAHAAGIIHRDIKPANIMIQPDGQPKLMDFGVAHVDDSVMTATGQIIGSPSYMSPEQVAGSEVTPRSDVYSLAVVAYEMLTGRSPFQARSITAVIYRVMHDNPPPPRQWNETLPTRYDEVFARALAKDPAERFGSATEFAGALDVREFELNLADIVPEDAMPSEPVPAVSTLEGPDEEVLAQTKVLPPPARRRVSPPWGLLGALGVTLVVALVIQLRSPSQARAPSLDTSPLPVVSPLPTSSPEAPEAPTAAKATPPPAPRPARTSSSPTAAKAEVTVAADPSSSADPEPVTPGAGVVALDETVTPPRRVEGSTASYPDVARRRRLAGTVTVSMVVSETGEVLEPRVVESAGDVLDQAVLDAVATWRFEPARKDDEAVRVRWTVRQTFRFSR